jgi:GLPGLI family protein
MNLSGVNDFSIMKKKVILIILLLSIIFNGKSQLAAHRYSIDKYKVLDSAFMNCTYKLNYIIDTLNKSRISTDIQTLQIGKDISKYYSQYLLDYSVKVKKLTDQGAQNVPSLTNYGACSYEVFKYYPKGKYTVTDFGTRQIRANVHEELIPVIPWVIGNEFDTVLSYRCQKAVTKFKGRTYEAWFTTEIPIGNGPWKLGGLPGLIMKVSDSQHYFNFECIGLEILKIKEPIKFYLLKYTQIQPKDLNNLYSRYYSDPVGFSKSMGGLEVFMVNGKEATNVKFPYNPIEIK